MQIYIDESGVFLQPREGYRVSAVGALAVPDARAGSLFSAFDELKRGWKRKATEVKGSTLSEIEIAGLIELVGGYECLFDVRGIDMGLHDAARIATFQDRQATAITAEITSSHHESWRKWGETTERKMRNLAPQLFTQAMTTIYLVIDLLQPIATYYVQRLPNELGRFEWKVDPKDPIRRTELEELWTDVVLPMAQTQSESEPLVTMEGCDYSFFEKFYVEREEMPEGLGEHVGETGDGGADFEKILKDLTFPESKNELGLQIIDILLNAFTRALNGRLGERGWAMLGRLMTSTARNRSRMVFLRLSPTEALPVGRRAYTETLARIEAGKRDILTPDRRG